jgi:hypothetical protein
MLRGWDRRQGENDAWHPFRHSLTRSEHSWRAYCHPSDRNVVRDEQGKYADGAAGGRVYQKPSSFHQAKPIVSQMARLMMEARKPTRHQSETVT